MTYSVDGVVMKPQQRIDRVAFTRAGPSEQVGLVTPGLCGVDGPRIHFGRLSLTLAAPGQGAAGVAVKPAPARTPWNGFFALQAGLTPASRNHTRTNLAGSSMTKVVGPVSVP